MLTHRGNIIAGPIIKQDLGGRLRALRFNVNGTDKSTSFAKHFSR